MKTLRSLGRRLPALAGLVPLAALLVSASGCAEGRRYDQAICVLMDVSGTYADQRAEVVRIVKREVLPSMEPGDTLLVIRIDGESYEKDNVEALVTLDARPSRANAQKLAIAQKLDALARAQVTATHTDIHGAMMLGGEYLRELGSGSRVMLVFSDMEEDLAPGTVRRLDEHEFEGIHVVAMNVKRLGADNADPEVFRSRMAGWEQTVMSAGGREWRTLMDSSRLGVALGEMRSS